MIAKENEHTEMKHNLHYCGFREKDQTYLDNLHTQKELWAYGTMSQKKSNELTEMHYAYIIPQKYNEQF